VSELVERIKELERELDKLRDQLAAIKACSWVPEQFTYVDGSGTLWPPYSTSWPPDSTSPGPALLQWQPTPVL